MNRMNRVLLVLTGVIGILGLVGWGGFTIAQNVKPTAEKVAQFADSVDLTKLTGEERATALKKFEEMVNGLTLEERRKWRMGNEWRRWFERMSESEKGQFMEATMPSGFTQVLNVFEDMPEERRKQIIDGAMRELKATHQLATDREPGMTNSMYGTNPPPGMSAELEKRARMIGLKTFYTESSAEAKAELAPFLEELQHQMEMGKAGH